MEHIVQELANSQVQPSQPVRITMDRYDRWRRGFVFDGMRNLRYGQSFCNYFNITDNILFYCDTVSRAHDYIIANYIQQ